MKEWDRRNKLRIRSSQRWAASRRTSERGCDEDSEGVQGFRDELVVGPFASLLAGQHAGVDENLEVVGDGRLGETDRIGQLADAGFGVLMGSDEGDEAESGGVGQRLEPSGQGFGLGGFDHLTDYR
jgi:hypothetical protein